jgi:uncharacterized protein with HEPN domain
VNRDEPYLKDILVEIEKLRRFTSRGREDFLNNDMAQYAVIHAIQIIGEAVKRLSQEAKDAHPATQWKRIAGMRDVVVHDYAGVKLDLVWDTVIESIPSLETTIRSMLTRLE